MVFLPARRTRLASPTRETVPITIPPQIVDPSEGALEAFSRAVSGSSGYRAWLAARGVDPTRVRSLANVPFLTKEDVFGSAVSPWLVEGGTSDAAELLTSSGQSGSFSVGVTSRAEQISAQATIDAALRSIGVDEATPTLLLNCLPMGIGVPTTLATVANPSVHLEMAMEIYRRMGPDFKRVVILAEPVFLKELAERLYSANGPAWSTLSTTCFVGGEWVSESWRQHVSALLGSMTSHDQRGDDINISFGAAELGLNLLFETPELRSLRRALDEGQARIDFAHDFDFTPSLFTFDPTRLVVEEREHEAGTTLAFTPLERRALPLVRYDLDDVGEFIPADRVNYALAHLGVQTPLPYPVVAVWGRRTTGLQVGDAMIRPEEIKQRLFRFAAEASVLTGRFFLDNATETLHLQLRQDSVATPRIAGHIADHLARRCGREVTIEAHPHDDYPYHAAGDFQHKPSYLPNYRWAGAT